MKDGRHYFDAPDVAMPADKEQRYAALVIVGIHGDAGSICDFAEVYGSTQTEAFTNAKLVASALNDKVKL